MLRFTNSRELAHDLIHLVLSFNLEDIAFPNLFWGGATRSSWRLWTVALVGRSQHTSTDPEKTHCNVTLHIQLVFQVLAW
jgi:hypothetical protein